MGVDMRRWVGAAVVILLAGASVQEELKPGLLAEFWHIDQEMQDFPVLDAQKKPVLRRLDKQINFEPTAEKFQGTDFQEYFYVRWTGLLRVPKAGKYVFFTESDDGSRLWIEGKLVVENGGLHAMEEKSGEVELKAGDHDFKVDLFENNGEVGCKVSWETEGKAKELIPEAAFLHRPDKELDK
jgi:hypothetical protein